RSRRGCTVPCSSFTAATIPSSQAARPVDLPRPFRTLLASSRFPARGMPMSSPSGAMHSWNAFFSSCEKPRWRWAIEKSVLHKLRFPHDFVARFSLCCEGGSPFFPPLRRGGRGGGYGTTSHTRFPRSLLLSPFASLSRGEKNWSRPSRIPHHPPYPPFARGGKGIACDVVSARAPKTRGSKPSLQLGEHPLYITRQWRLRFSDSASLRS